jgi:hypothetical protein
MNQKPAISTTPEQGYAPSSTPSPDPLAWSSGAPPAAPPPRTRAEKPASRAGNKPAKKRKEKAIRVKAIFGARQADEDDAAPPLPSPSPIESSSRAFMSASKPVKTHLQLLRPAQLSDASVLAAALVDARVDLVRDLSPLEKCLREANTTFRVVGALGKAGAGRSTLLSALLESDSSKPANRFPGRSGSLDVFVHEHRRIFLARAPASCVPGAAKDLSTRGLEAPPGLSFQQFARMLDLRFACCLLATSQVVLVVVEEGDFFDAAEAPRGSDVDVDGEGATEEEEQGREAMSILRLLAVACKIVRAKAWQCAKIVLVRNKTRGVSGTRRTSADLVAARRALGPDVDLQVVHVPHWRSWALRESFGAGVAAGGAAGHAADQDKEQALFALRPVRLVRSNGDVSERASEQEWLSCFVMCWSQSQSPGFLQLAQELAWI